MALNENLFAYNQLIHFLIVNEALGRVESSINSDSGIHLANYFLASPQLIYERNNEAGCYTEFLKHRVVCIAGMPGVGKSTLAIKFGYHYLSKSSSATVRFFKASTVLKLSEDYKRLAENLKVNDENEENRIDKVNRELTKLAETKQILFVFDNVDNYEFVEKYIRNLPRKVSVLLTVRTKETISLHENIYFEELKPFSLEESTDYIKKALSDRDDVSKQKIEDIVKILGDDNNEVIPFNLNKVVSIISKSYQPIDKLLANIKQCPEKYLQIEFYKEIMENGMFAKILEYIPYFDPDSIDLNLLAEMTEQEENDAWDAALNGLEKNFLIKINKKNHELSVHRLLQIELSEYLEEKLEVRSRFAEIIEEKIEIENLYNGSLKSIPFAHADRLIQTNWFNELQDNEIKAKLFKKMGIFCWHVQTGMLMSSFLQNSLNIKKHFIPGKIDKALEYLNKALEIQKKLSIGQDNEEIANTYYSIGIVYTEKREFDRALEYLNKALDMLKILNSKTQIHS